MKIKQSGQYVYSYDKWLSILDGKDTIKLNQNTKVVRNDFYNTLEFYLHGTCILTLSKKDRFLYNINGWSTLTTKRRLNQLGPLTIYQEDFIWYYQDSSIHKKEYQDGIIVGLYTEPYDSLW